MPVPSPLGSVTESGDTPATPCT